MTAEMFYNPRRLGELRRTSANRQKLNLSFSFAHKLSLVLFAVFFLAGIAPTLLGGIDWNKEVQPAVHTSLVSHGRLISAILTELEPAAH